MKTTLLILTWNEIEAMRVVMPQIKKEWVDQILVVDGGSTDGTIEYCRERGIEVFIQKERGLRKAYRESFPHATGDIVITFAPDGSSIADRIPPLIEKMKEGYDMVIVSRYLDGAISEDDDALTAFGNWMFTTLMNVFFGGNYTDVMVMYRAYRKNLPEELGAFRDETYQPWERLFGTVCGLEPILSMRCAKRKLRTSEIPGDEPARIGGTRKLQPFRWGLVHLIQIFQERLGLLP